MDLANWRKTADPDDDSDYTEFVPSLDEDPRAFARPANIGTIYVEEEYNQLAEQQPPAYEAKGHEESADAGIRAEGQKHDADMAEAASGRSNERAGVASGQHIKAMVALNPYKRRPRDSKSMKYGRLGLMLFGDVGSIAGAILLLGEEPVYALFQAISVAAAAITLGAIGREIKHLQAARAREGLDPGDDQAAYRSFFTGKHSGELVVKLVSLASLLGTIVISGSIYALRYDVEGGAAALAFGGFALAFGIASFCNAYDTADEVADFLEDSYADVGKHERDAAAARSVKVIKTRAEAVAERNVTVARNKAEGEAAKAGAFVKLFRVLVKSANVVGHGHPPAPSGGEFENNGHNPHQAVLFSDN